MSALGRKVLDLAEQQGLLDSRAIVELRKQVAESKFVITPEAIAKVLVDHGHLTPFQARKLVSQALGNEPDPVEQRAAEKEKPRKGEPEEELTLADDSSEEVPLARADDEEDDDDEIVELEAMEPKPAAAGRPGGKKPAGPKEKPPAALERPVEGSTAEDFVELEPVDPTPPTRGNRWKTDVPEIGETIELTPVDLSAPSPTPAEDLVPIDDLFGPDPFAAPAARQPAAPRPPEMTSRLSEPPPATPTAPARPLAPVEAVARPLKNVWDSPLLLIGGGALGVILVLFGLLSYALTRGSAAEMFGKAEEEYQSGSYGSAIAIYEKFLKQYPDDPNASLARVRRGMASLRQVTDDGKNPRLGLETARQVLPQIETEEKFQEARGELASILPDIADGFATQAAQAQEGSRKQELVKQAGEALALVNNPSYLPTSMRKQRESHIARVVDRLKVAERSIQQEKDLAGAVEKIAAATEKGNAAAAYEVQSELLRTYPGLAASTQLVAAVRQIGEKERQLVSVSRDGPPPLTKDHPAGSERVVISFREGPAASGAAGQPVFLLVEGAVYGIDVASGRVLWRRFVGYETTNAPISIENGGTFDAVLIDGRRHELVRLKGSSGELVWRQELNEDAAGPVTSGSRILVTTRKGRVIAFEAATGAIAAAAQLPQGALVAPAVRQSRIFQLGEHSTLFVLDANSLACSETVYLGHKAGAILVPPVAVLDHLLVVDSPGDDYSEIQVLSTDAKRKKLAPLGKPQRLKGRVTTPLAVSGARVAAITDLGQIAVYEVDPGGSTEPLRFVAGVAASEPAPRSAFCQFDQDRNLVVAGHRRTLFEVQAALQQLARRWTENHDDTFLAPLRLQDGVLVQVRRRSGVSAVLIQGCRASSGDALWTTHLAAPIVAFAPSEPRQTVDALTSEGRLYAIRGEQFAARQIDKPDFSLPGGGTAILPDAFLSADGQLLVWTESKAAGSVYLYEVKTGSPPAAIRLPARSIAPAVALEGGVLAPLSDGSVALVGRDGATTKVGLFMPPLTPDALPLWTKPTPLADGKTFVISDGRGTVYAVAKQEKPQPHLAEVGKSRLNGPVISPLVLAGSTAIGVIRQERSDAVAGFDARGAAVFEPVALEGRVEAGPFAVGGLAFVAAEPDGLICYSSDGKVRWQHAEGELEHGPVAGPMVATTDGDLIVVHQSGMVCRLHPATGKELARHDVGEPLLGPTCILGQHVFVAGSAGVIHRVALPQRP